MARLNNLIAIAILFTGTATSAVSAADPSCASEPTPADGATQVAIPVRLTWMKGDQVQATDGHMVLVGTDKEKVAQAFYRNHPNVQVYVVSSPSLALPSLGPNTTYYWRVDQVNEEITPGLWKGEIWRFTTDEAASSTLFVADFDTDHDILAQGVEGTGWDGFVGRGPRETADRIAFMNGTCVLQSTDARYDGGTPLGPLLYRTVTGDFKATVRVAGYQSIAYNNGGIMARAANRDDAGRGEDWVSVDYFPLYGGIYARMSDDNRRTENANNGQGRGADKYLQLELVGNLFFLRHSADGVEWHDLSCSPIARNDLVNVPLQVGLFQATYTRNQAQVGFDDFRLETGEQVKTARLHLPADGAQGTPKTLTLSWIPGAGAEHHDVYFGTSLGSVQAADRADAGAYKGRQAVGAIEYEVDGLQDGATYYWRVDEVDGDQVHRGAVWSFTVYDRTLADFEDYTSDADLASVWNVSGATVRLSDAEPHRGKQSLELNCRGVDGANPAQVTLTFAQKQDWSSSRYTFRSLRVFFQGHPDNRIDKLCLAFEDNNWGTCRTVVPYEGNPAHLKTSDWTRWDIDLRDLVTHNPTFRLSDVKRMTLVTEGAGRLWFDDISLEYRQEVGPNQEPWPRLVQPERFVEAVPFEQVTVTGGLWRERMEVNRKVSLPHVWDKCEFFRRGDGQESRRLDNFRKAAGQMPGEFTGTYFNDSDVYKIIQGTAYSLQNHPDPNLEAYTDKLIDSIAAAQWDDGYLYTFYSIPHKPESRWTNIGSMHELYCAGHLFEGAVAYYQATGKRKLLDVAIKFADHICETFGPGKKTNPPGHQEIELALMQLYEVTGNQKYMDTAKFFIDQRGHDQGRSLYGTYSQDHIPFVQQEKGVGHSVRAGYMYCGATDIVRINHDEAYANALFRLWDNITNTKTYLTGGIGQPGGPEGFANDYELGNNCYAETCSGIAFAMWNHRLHQLTGDAKYLDCMERTFLNNTLSSLSQEGDKHFYTNPLTTNGRSRWEWPGHDCACCPSNLVRVIASIGGYAYSHDDDTIHVNMYLESNATIPLPGNSVELTQTTRYPWDGDIRIRVAPEKAGAFAVKLRIPGWARNIPQPGNLYKYLDECSEPVTVAVNDQPLEIAVDQGYVTIERTWQAGDTIHLLLPMPIRRVIAHPKATADAGLVAIERGPMVYCAEFKDNDFDVADLKLPDDLALDATYEEDLFGGAVTITSRDNSKLKLIPYHLYANRGEGWIRVWMPRL